MILALILSAAAPDYDAHIALQRKIHGAAVADLDAVVEAPFVVWGDAGKVQDIEHGTCRPQATEGRGGS